MTRRFPHRYIGVRESPAGHVGICVCGWESGAQWDRQTAQCRTVEHIAEMAAAVIVVGASDVRPFGGRDIASDDYVDTRPESWS